MEKPTEINNNSIQYSEEDIKEELLDHDYFGRSSTDEGKLEEEKEVKQEPVDEDTSGGSCGNSSSIFPRDHQISSYTKVLENWAQKVMPPGAQTSPELNKSSARPPHFPVEKRVLVQKTAQNESVCETPLADQLKKILNERAARPKPPPKCWPIFRRSVPKIGPQVAPKMLFPVKILRPVERGLAQITQNAPMNIRNIETKMIVSRGENGELVKKRKIVIRVEREKKMGYCRGGVTMAEAVDEDFLEDQMDMFGGMNQPSTSTTRYQHQQSFIRFTPPPGPRRFNPEIHIPRRNPRPVTVNDLIYRPGSPHRNYLGSDEPMKNLEPDKYKRVTVRKVDQLDTKKFDGKWRDKKVERGSTEDPILLQKRSEEAIRQSRARESNINEKKIWNYMHSTQFATEMVPAHKETEFEKLVSRPGSLEKVPEYSDSLRGTNPELFKNLVAVLEEKRKIRREKVREKGAEPSDLSPNLNRSQFHGHPYSSSIDMVEVCVNGVTRSVPAMTQCHLCGDSMHLILRKGRYKGELRQYPAYRCLRKGCQTFRSVKNMLKMERLKNNRGDEHWREFLNLEPEEEDMDTVEDEEHIEQEPVVKQEVEDEEI